MLDDLFSVMLNYKEYIILCVAFCVIITLLVWLQAVNFSITPFRFKIYRIFITLNVQSSILLVLIVSRLLYVISALLFIKTIDYGEIFALILLVFSFDIVCRDLKIIALDVISSTMLIIALVVYGTIYQYIVTIFFNIYLLIVLIAVGIFILLYNVGWFLESLKMIINIKYERQINEKK